MNNKEMTPIDRYLSGLLLEYTGWRTAQNMQFIFVHVPKKPKGSWVGQWELSRKKKKEEELEEYNSNLYRKLWFNYVKNKGGLYARNK